MNEKTLVSIVAWVILSCIISVYLFIEDKEKEYGALTIIPYLFYVSFAAIVVPTALLYYKFRDSRKKSEA